MGSATAGFGVRSARDPLPARRVEHPLVLPKGWTEGELGLSRLTSRVGEQNWRRTELDVGVRHGLAPGWELFGRLPWRAHHRPLRQTGFGTAQVGTRVGLLAREAPSRFLAMEFRGGLPLGFDGGEVPDTAGTADLRIAVQGRQKWGGLRLDGEVGGRWRFEGRPAWFGARIKPGNEVFGALGALLQLGPLIVGTKGRLTARQAVVGRGEVLPETGGIWGEVGTELGLQISRGVDLAVDGNWTPLRGNDRFVWVEEIHPSGRRWGLRTRGRW